MPYVRRKRGTALNVHAALGILVAVVLLGVMFLSFAEA